jgi:hypothetical protein
MRSPRARPQVLRSDVSRDDIDDAMERCGWRITNVFVGSATHPGQVIYATADRRSSLYLVEDPRLGVLYFTGTGPTIDEALAEVRACLPTADIEQALASVHAPPDASALGQALAVVVLTAGPDPSPRRSAAMVSALRHRDPAIRHAALVAATYAAWPGLHSAIAELASHDPVATIRADATRVLEALYEPPSSCPTAAPAARDTDR